MGISHKNNKKILVFVSEKSVLFFKKSEVIFTNMMFYFSINPTTTTECVIWEQHKTTSPT